MTAKKHSIVMEFDSENTLQSFFAWLADGGGEQHAGMEDENGVEYGMDFEYHPRTIDAEGKTIYGPFLGDGIVRVKRGSVKTW